MNTAKLKVIQTREQEAPKSGGEPGYARKHLTAPYFELDINKTDTPGLLKLRLEALKKKKCKPIVKEQNFLQKLLKLCKR